MVRVPRLRTPPFDLSDAAFQIVGVVHNAANSMNRDQIMPEVYIPYTFAGLSDMLLVSTQTQPMAVANGVRQQVYAIDKDQPVTDVMPLATMLDQWVYAAPRFNLALFSVFAGLGLILAAVGVYGVISYMVTQQTQEIGLRIALGAGFRDIAGLVLGRGVRLLAGGIVLGLAGSFAAARLLSRQLWNVSPFDPISFAAVAVFLLLIGIQACFWPARRAAKVDPVTALRYE
jgi:ABC-type antimicrobial peptide transport system permease subunit